MPRFTGAWVAAALVVCASGHSQTDPDRISARQVPGLFCAAFNRHNGHQLAQLMSEDVDFVTVGATLLHGRADFEKYHTRLLGGRFHGMTLEPLQVQVRYLRPDVALIHWSWTGAGDRNPDGSTRQRRYGMMTMVAEKHLGTWKIVASQNDNSMPGLAPEFDGIKTPMPIPDQVREPTPDLHQKR